MSHFYFPKINQSLSLFLHGDSIVTSISFEVIQFMAASEKVLALQLLQKQWVKCDT